ncbi:MAG: RES domain-containing protein [Rubritalea sp.]|jgi:RES domain-containing protein
MGKSTEYACGYRIVAPRWAHEAISGEGARKFGGRWNSPGRAMTYLGGSRALAALELLVNLPSPLSRAKPFRMIEVKIPKKLVVNYLLSVLPEDWRESPAPRAAAVIGDDWLDVCGQLAMRVPSVLIPEETNILLNSNHPLFKEVICGEAREFSFDKRL